MDIIWQYSTRNFQVTLECEPEQDPDLSWADQETLDNIASGLWDNLTFKVAVYYDGEEIGCDYLGNSIYENPSDFRRGGGYFRDMLSEACRAARTNFNKQRPRLRAAT